MSETLERKARVRHGGVRDGAAVGAPAFARLRSVGDVREWLAARDRSVALGALPVAVLLGGYVRLLLVTRADFPVNDGGLFYLMTRELQRAGYALPAFTSYNGAGIPFAYPPLGLYLAAALSDVTGWALLDVMRLLPAVLSTATIPAFFLLSQGLLRSAQRAALATVAFALLPRTFVWFVMGGGLTRAPGFLFSVLMLHQAYRMYNRHERRYVLSTAVLAALAVASHLESAWFAAYSAALLFLFYGRHRRGVVDSILVTAGVLALTAPWWVAVVSRHGVAPFLDAAAGAGRISGLSAWAPVKTFDFTDEPYLALFGVLGLLGAFLSLAEGRLLGPVWLAVIFVLNPRNPAAPAAVPLAMLVGICVDCLLRAVLGRASGRATERPVPTGKPAGGATRWRARALLPRAAAGAMLAYLALYATMNARAATEFNPLVRVLPREQRAAMEWAAGNTPTGSVFLALSFTPSWFGGDQTAEWFPALAGRANLVTVQGYEWLPDAQFAARIKRYDETRACGQRDVRCLEQWAAMGGRTFTHIFLPAEECCAALAASLRAAGAYELVYDRGGVAIFARREAPLGSVVPAPAAVAGHGRAGGADEPSS